MEKIKAKTLNNLKSPSREKAERAFEEIYREYSYLVYYISLKIVRRREIACEVTNESFLRFFENRDNIKSGKNIKYYLVVTAKNLSLNALKKEHLSVCSDFLEEKRENKEEEDGKDEFADYVEKFRSFLSEEEIELVVLHLLYGFKFREIAADKRVGINAVSSKYKRTLDKIKSHYKGENEL